MAQSNRLGFVVIIFGLLSWSVGCTSERPPAVPQSSRTEPEASPPSDMPPPEQPQSAEPAPLPTEGNPAGEPGVEGTPEPSQPAAEDQSEAVKIEANLASFSEEDRLLAQKQKICPISGEPLGTMGPPIKVVVAGHEVFICCEHCEDPLVTDPEKHLAKIGLEPEEEEESLQ